MPMAWLIVNISNHTYPTYLTVACNVQVSNSDLINRTLIQVNSYLKWVSIKVQLAMSNASTWQLTECPVSKNTLTHQLKNKITPFPLLFFLSAFLFKTEDFVLFLFLSRMKLLSWLHVCYRRNTQEVKFPRERENRRHRGKFCRYTFYRKTNGNENVRQGGGQTFIIIHFTPLYTYYLPILFSNYKIKVAAQSLPYLGDTFHWVRLKSTYVLEVSKHLNCLTNNYVCEYLFHG